VAPWDEVKKSLQPNFELAAQTALEEVLPVSASMSDLAYLGLGARFSSTLSTPTASDGATGSSQDKILPERKSLGEESKNSKNISLKSEPLLRYLAATALLQEVQLLNQYLNYAPIPKSYVPYLVRLQISLMPSRRDMPYDAYTLLSFFQEPIKPTDQPSIPLKGEKYCKSVGAPTQSKNTAEGTTQIPLVIPLLVSDSLEAASSARSREMLLSLALGLSAATQGAGATAGVESALNKLQSSTSNDLNSLFSVARVSPNTLRVRMGAYRNGVKTYTMVPRTHTVSVLVLVPDSYFCIGGISAEEISLVVISKTNFVNVLNGERLNERKREEALNHAREFIQSYLAQDTQCNYKCLTDLLNATHQNDLEAFIKTAKQYKIPAQSQYSMWVDLNHARCGGMYTVALFPVPAPKAPSGPTPHKDKTGWLKDDGKDKTTATIALTNEGCKAITRTVLEIKSTNPPLYLSAVPPKLYYSKNELCTATFASLANWGFKAKELVGKVNLIAYRDSTSGDLYPAYYHSMAKVDGQAGGENDQLKITAATNTIMTKDAKGTITLAVEVPKTAGNKKDFCLRLNGADLQATQPSWGEVAERKGELILVKKSGNVTLHLTNLKECEPVTFIPVPGKVALMTIPVRQAK